VLPRCREVIGEEDRVENVDQVDTAPCGRCFKVLLGILFGPGDLLTLRPLMAS